MKYLAIKSIGWVPEKLLQISFITSILITIVFRWGHIQGRSNHVMDLYLSCIQHGPVIF